MEKLNIRVYGILIDQNRLLVSDEYRFNRYMTKFPGGGLKTGKEGTVTCLKRECREEMGQEINIVRHFYTTDFLQKTWLLDEPQQLISIYYLISASKPYQFRISEKQYDFEERIDGAQSFRWIGMNNLSANELTFPIDKKVVEMIEEDFRNGRRFI